MNHFVICKCDKNVDIFFLLYNNNTKRFPFNWKNPFGYSIIFLGQWIGSVSAAGVVVQFLSLVFGSCWFFIFITNDINRDLAAFKTAIETPNENQSDLTKRFCNLVQIYSDVKE